MVFKLSEYFSRTQFQYFSVKIMFMVTFVGTHNFKDIRKYEIITIIIILQYR